MYDDALTCVSASVYAQIADLFQNKACELCAELQNLQLVAQVKTRQLCVPLDLAFLQAGGIIYCPMQNFHIAKHLPGLLVVSTECNIKMIKTCEK